MSVDPISTLFHFLGAIPFWGWIILTAIVLFLAAAIMGSSEAKKAGKRAGKIIQSMDNRYNRFIETKMSNKIIESDSITMNKEELIASAVIVLKPDVESLISLINSVNYEDVKVDYNSRFFNNIVTLCQALFRASKRNESKTLSPGEEEKLYTGIKDSILADLTSRMEEMEKV
jgi:hypothetical protein